MLIFKRSAGKMKDCIHKLDLVDKMLGIKSEYFKIGSSFRNTEFLQEFLELFSTAHCKKYIFIRQAFFSQKITKNFYLKKLN